MKLEKYREVISILENIKGDIGIDYPEGWQEALDITLSVVRARQHSQETLDKIHSDIFTRMENDSELDPNWLMHSKSD